MIFLSWKRWRELESERASLAERLTAAESRAAAAEAKVELLTTERDSLKTDNEKHIDRMLSESNRKTMYSEPAKWTPPGDPIKPVATPSDICKDLQKLEDQAFREERLLEGKAVLAELDALRESRDAPKAN